jgi:hypothetical protein
MKPVNVLSRRNQQLCGMDGSDPDPGQECGRGRANQLSQRVFYVSDFIIEGIDPARNRAQREFHGLDRVMKS